MKGFHQDLCKSLILYEEWDEKNKDKACFFNIKLIVIARYIVKNAIYHLNALLHVT